MLKLALNLTYDVMVDQQAFAGQMKQWKAVMCFLKRRNQIFRRSGCGSSNKMIETSAQLKNT